MFTDRDEAGRRLGEYLQQTGITADLVLGLPRGGVPVAAAVAHGLGLPLDVLVVRKLGLPRHPEVAMGAIGEGGVRVIDADLVRRAGVTLSELSAVERHERAVLESRAERLRADTGRRDLAAQVVLIVDDGIATGATASAACLVARSLGAARVIVAAPVGGPDAMSHVQGADKVICLERPAVFRAVGEHYRDFRPTTDADVARILKEARSNDARRTR